MKRLTLFLALLLGTAIASAQQFPEQNLNSNQSAQAAYKDAMAHIGLDQKLGSYVEKTPEVFDETGKKMAFADLIGNRPVILLPMFFTCKSACGIEIDDLLKSLAKVTAYTPGKDYDVVFLSIDPMETPEVAMNKKQLLMKDYDRNGSGAGFHFVTGSYENVNKICQSVGFRYMWKPETQQVFHPTGLVVLTKTGMISRYFYGTEYSPKMLQTSLVAALRLQVGMQATPILLGCITCDPVTGAKSLNVMRTLQVLGLLTLIVLFGSMAWMGYRHRDSVKIPNDGGTA